ncbi:MAG TPA: ABC transporter permease subunit, partial [Candidatus Dormibacteraeota bacterium]|nr:ABC transporter permease subunit [Candidatus Dormibacteraeota bacterium]
MPSGVFLDYVDPWVNWTWLSTHIPLFTDALQQHLLLTAIAVAGGLALSLPLGIAAHLLPSLRNPVLVIFGIVYTIPSLALFALLVPYTGLGIVTAEVGLIGYTVLILVRNILIGLESVPPDVLDAADGMGYRPMARLFRV